MFIVKNLFLFIYLFSINYLWVDSVLGDKGYLINNQLRQNNQTLQTFNLTVDENISQLTHNYYSDTYDSLNLSSVEGIIAFDFDMNIKKKEMTFINDTDIGITQISSLYTPMFIFLFSLLFSFLLFFLFLMIQMYFPSIIQKNI